jgi:HK97 family phage major capsid protein
VTDNVTLADIAAAVESKAAATAEQLAQKDAELQQLKGSLEQVNSKIAEQEQIKAELAELKAKLHAPGIISQTSTTEKVKAKEAFIEWVRKGTDALSTKGTDLRASTDSQGGYAVPDELVRQIIQLEHEVSPLRQICDVQSIGTPDVRQLVAHGAAANGWVGETAARPQTDAPDLAQRVGYFGEVYARPRAYQHVLEDAFFDIESWLASEVARGFAEAEAEAFLRGDGNNKPIGILHGLTAGTAVGVDNVTGRYQVISTGTNDVLGNSDVNIAKFLREQVITSMVTGYLNGSIWLMNKTTYATLATLKDQNDQFYLNPNIADPSVQRLFGFPIVINDDMDPIAQVGATFPIIFGNFRRAFRIYDRVGVSTLRDPYTNPGSIMFYTRKRVGSMKLDVNAIKIVTVPSVD